MRKLFEIGQKNWQKNFQLVSEYGNFDQIKFVLESEKNK